MKNIQGDILDAITQFEHIYKPSNAQREEAEEKERARKQKKIERDKEKKRKKKGNEETLKKQ